jgi:hypothetical protein
VLLAAAEAGEVCCSPSVCANVVRIMGELLINNTGIVNKNNSPNDTAVSLRLKFDICPNLFSC